jgi:hypothetical protein
MDVHIVNPRSKAEPIMNVSAGLIETEHNFKRNPTIVIFVNGMAAPSLARLRTRLGLNHRDPGVEWFSRIDAFSARIRRLPRDIGIGVLFIADEGRLTEIAALMGFLDSVRLILILPEENAVLRREARHLHPSYVLSPDSDFSDLTAVLDKIRVTPRPPAGVHHNTLN